MVRIPKPLNNYVMKSRTLAVQDYCFITLTDYPLTICCCSINHHKPTLCFHGNIFGYVVAWSFTLHISISTISRNVPIERYLHLSTATHTFVVIYSLSWMHCTCISLLHLHKASRVSCLASFAASPFSVLCHTVNKIKYGKNWRNKERKNEPPFLQACMEY